MQIGGKKHFQEGVLTEDIGKHFLMFWKVEGKGPNLKDCDTQLKLGLRGFLETISEETTSWRVRDTAHWSGIRSLKRLEQLDYETIPHLIFNQSSESGKSKAQCQTY